MFIARGTRGEDPGLSPRAGGGGSHFGGSAGGAEEVGLPEGVHERCHAKDRRTQVLSRGGTWRHNY